ncbi:hypothetical protein [Acinetobacter sp. WZC-1]|uniref:hypothetical protein n=1 Tax=Acinetobacter sp. WZC-1 TaxID=3459034 RepID=UPI00403DF7BC
MKNTHDISLPIFHSLVAAQFILPLIATSIDLFSAAPELQQIDEQLYKVPYTWELFIIAISVFIILAISIGLFQRREWARKAYIYTFFPAFLIYFLPSMHWSYMSSYAAIFENLAFVCSGILLTILVIPSLYQPLFAGNSA